MIEILDIKGRRAFTAAVAAEPVVIRDRVAMLVRGALNIELLGVVGASRLRDQRRLRTWQPEILFTGAHGSVGALVKSIRKLKQTSPTAKIIVLAPDADEESTLEAIMAGADGYLVEPFSSEELMHAVAAVGSNGAPLSPCVACHLVRVIRSPEIGTRPAGATLTSREREVVAKVAGGSSDKEVASALRLSVLTVKRHLHNVYQKLGVRNRVEAINCVSTQARRDNRLATSVRRPGKSQGPEEVRLRVKDVPRGTAAVRRTN